MLQTSTSSATATSSAAAITSSEVSMRKPCQVTTTSPGRSASQADAERQRADRQ